MVEGDPGKLPQVGKEIIDKMNPDLQVDATILPEIARDNPYLMVHFMSERLMEKGLEPAMAGACTVYTALSREAVRQRRKLPKVSLQTIKDFVEGHPLASSAERLIPLEGTKQFDEELQKIEQEFEFEVPSYSKYRPENPELMDYLEKLFNRGLRAGLRSKFGFLFTSWEFGALTTYELLRVQAQRDQLNRMNSA